jgi:hypothetical protein
MFFLLAFPFLFITLITLKKLLSYALPTPLDFTIILMLLIDFYFYFYFNSCVQYDCNANLQK